jgi:hypothetical protein
LRRLAHGILANHIWSVAGSSSRLVKVGNQPISFGAGLKYRADSPDAGPGDFGGRLIVTFLFPK